MPILEDLRGRWKRDMEALVVIEKIRRQLGPEYVAVRADHLVQLYQMHSTRERTSSARYSFDRHRL